MSTHECRALPVTLEKHPNADTLSIVRVGGYTVCVRTADWRDGQLGIYVEPDYVVPTQRAEFAFLAKPGRDAERIKVKKLRGVISHGLLIAAPEGAMAGQDFMEALGITRYEPPIKCGKWVTGGEAVAGPKIVTVKYDLESLRKYNAVFQEGEQVQVTEKIHGASARYCFMDGVMHVGSRGEWKRQDESNLWWRALTASPWIRQWCESHPSDILYGEVFGQVQDLKYGSRDNEIFFRAFDILRGGYWLSGGQFFSEIEVDNRVPVLYTGPYSAALIEKLANGQSTLASHMREGIVVKPLNERVDDSCGRVALKLVSDDYLMRD